MSRIGAALYALRGDRTIVAFAESIDIHRVTYATWERGSRTPSYKSVVHLAERLGMTTDEFMALVDRQKVEDSEHWRARRWNDMVDKWKERTK